MIASTRSDYPGMKVVKELGIVTGFDAALRPIRLTVSMAEYMESAIKDMSKEAEKLGANAILGINFSIGERDKPVVIGTAVVLEEE
ncbi:hypothetical protein BAU15_15065 [Enterococcus sp. JM4C]|uniref:heavy metal-binding domain-containing protein n=1 Tax=Candidatus Enterococcus huntleyi TaxID=1857217 RepID=UPI00137AF4E3|nr:heavy metal-binding domain-containing protein [Enterococcus sp. JM4C]KAF1296295.1 hypothetical protein BAU15_15065 [Enterococcus sp. JM4C]